MTHHSPREVSEEQYKALEKEAKRLGTTVDALVREAVDRHLDTAAFIRRRAK